MPTVRAPAARLAVDPPADAPWNFGRDEALHAAAAATGSVLLRVYGWSAPTVSFGRNETAVGQYSPARLAALGLTPTRRLTGGRALVHTAELTYAVAAPVDPSVSLRASVDGMNRVLAAALRSLGVGAALVPAGAPTVPVSAGACFGAPSVGEVMVDGQKLAGSAQWRDRGAFLQHGSILIRDDQPLLRAALAPGIVARDVPPAATLAQATAVPPAPAAFAAALAVAFAAEFGIEVELVASEALLAAGAGDRFAARYGDPAWIWRR